MRSKTFCRTPRGFKRSELGFPRGCSFTALQERERRCLPARLLGKPESPSTAFQDRTLLKCLSALARAACATSLKKRNRTLPRLFLLMRLMRLVSAEARVWAEV